MGGGGRLQVTFHFLARKKSLKLCALATIYCNQQNIVLHKIYHKIAIHTLVEKYMVFRYRMCNNSFCLKVVKRPLIQKKFKI